MNLKKTKHTYPPETSPKRREINQLSLSKVKGKNSHLTDCKVERKIKIRKVKSQDYLSEITLIPQAQAVNSKRIVKIAALNDDIGSSQKFIEWCKSGQQLNSKLKNKQYQKTDLLGKTKQPVLEEQKLNEHIFFKYKADIVQTKTLTSIINLNFSSKAIKLLGIMEGHGHFGPNIIKFLKKRLLQEIKTEIHLENDYEKLIKKNFKKLIQEAFNIYADNMFYSGATTTFCLIDKNDLYVTNIGNNKALIGYKDPKLFNDWSAKQISYDHILTEECQNRRIIKNGGKIFKQKNKGPSKNGLKVWGQHNGKLYGISMSRSFGDLSLTQYGVIYIPDTNRLTLTSYHKFIFVGQQGIFEFLSNDQILQICAFYYQNDKSLNGATQAINKQLLKLASSEQWSKQDFGFILVFLE